jgi:fibronectin-binding autotransporter adhesin
LGGTSTGTNTFYGPFSSGGSSFLDYSVAINGPGTYVFTNFIWATNSLTVSSNAHVVLDPCYFNSGLIPNNTFFTTVNFGSGSTLDVSAYDQIGTVFDVGGLAGSAGPGGQTIPSQTLLTIGHTNGTVTDINGSLALAPSSFAPPAGAAILDVAGPRVAGILSINGNFTPGTATLQIDMGPNAAASDTIQVTGNLDLSQGLATVNLNIAPQVTVQAGVPYTLIGYTGTLTGDASGLNAVVSSPSYTAVISSATPNVITVTFTSTGVVDTRLPYLLWQGAVNGNWDTTTANWFNGVVAGSFQNSLNVFFNDSSSQTSVGIIGSVAPASTTVSNNVDSYTFSGGSLAGGSLLKQGSGSLTLSSGNVYSGGTVVSAGTVVAGNITALSTGTVTLGDTNSGANPINLFLNAGIANNINVTSNSIGTVMLAYPGTGSVTYSGLLTFQHDLIISNNSTVGNSLTFSANIAGTGNWTVYGGGGIKLQNSSSPLQETSRFCQRPATPFRS